MKYMLVYILLGLQSFTIIDLFLLSSLSSFSVNSILGDASPFRIPGYTLFAYLSSIFPFPSARISISFSVRKHSLCPPLPVTWN